MLRRTIVPIAGPRRPGRAGRRSALVALMVLTLPALAPAQDYLRTMATDPILVFSGDGHRSLVHRILYTHDGRQLLTAGEDKDVLVWNLAENPPRLSPGSLRPLIWKRKRGAIYAMALSRNAGDESGRLILGGYGIEDGGGTLTVFRYPGAAPGAERDTGELLAHWTGNAPGVQAVGPATQGQVPGHRAEIMDLAFDPGGRFVASASIDQVNPIQVWDATTGRMQRRLSDARDPGKFQALALAYTPDGGRLIAGGRGKDRSPDGRIRLWNLRQAPGSAADTQPIRIAVDGGPDRPVQAHIRTVAASPDGRWLIAGLAWPVPVYRSPKEQSGLILVDLKAPSGTAATPLPFRRPGAANSPLGEVFDAEFIDNNRFAIAVLDSDGRPSAEKGNRRDRLATWIQIRSAPDGRVLENVRNPDDDPDGPPRPWPGIAKALAVSPDRKQLAFVEGERNRVVLKDLGQAGVAGVPLAGAAAEGARAWEVGFVRGKEIPAIAYSSTRADAAAGQPEFTGFDLETLRPLPAPVAADGVARSLESFGDYRIRIVPGSAHQLDLLRGNALVGQIQLHPDRMGQWQRWTFIPPAPGHPRLCLAIACEFGVAIYSVDDLKSCKRLLKGHSDHVLDLAPDPDGRWLVTGGADQTVRLWSLDGCDRTPDFGARFRADRGGWIVDAVAARSPADLQGLARGDRLLQAHTEDAVRTIGPALAAEWDRSEPGQTLRLRTLRPPTPTGLRDYGALMKAPVVGARREMVSANKADSPVLSLFRAGPDWIAWMPQGYYETSVQGDRFYLGWHINNNGPDEIFNPRARPRPTSFVPMITFQDRLRKPEVLQRLLRSGSVLQALPSSPSGPILTSSRRDIGRRPQDAGPGVLKPSDMPLIAAIQPRPIGPNDLNRAAGRDLVQVNVATLPVRLRVEGQPGQRMTRVRVLDNGMEEQDIVNPAADVPGEIDLTFQIAPGRRRKTVEVTADNGRVGEVSWEYERSAPTDHDGRLVVLAFGPGFEGLGDLRLDHAPKDAKAVAQGLSELIIQPWDSSPPYGSDPGSPRIIATAPDRDLVATAGLLADALADLESQVRDGKLGRKGMLDADFVRDGAPVDTVALFVNTHLLASGSQRMVLGEAGQPQELLENAINGEEMARSLGFLVRHGCRVVVFVDGVHLPSDRDRTFDVIEWARQLQEERVATYIASVDNRPSEPAIDGKEGPFAWGIREVLRGNFGDTYAKKTKLTAKDLGEVIAGLVHDRTGRRQMPQYCNSLTSWDYLPLVSRSVDR